VVAPSPEPLGSLKGLKRSNNEPAAQRGQQVNRQAEAENSRAKLVGQKAAPLAVEAWVNGSPVSDDDLKGKVVLLDFWAVWCGPCIATFPHLREWNEKYAGKGLVMIGLTNYYNYDWDEQAGKATRSALEVSPEKEQAMLVKFAAQHKLTHRFGIQKDHGQSKVLRRDGYSPGRRHRPRRDRSADPRRQRRRERQGHRRAARDAAVPGSKRRRLRNLVSPMTLALPLGNRRIRRCSTGR
jgi:thiol-disulfide isomerase/thioredoxin